jgi:hypothetical protein
MTTVAPAVAPVRDERARRNRPAFVFASLLLLVAAYGLLSLLNDPRGTLGTDTGGKLATLATMDRDGSFDPDLGYWAEAYDRDGHLHPLYYTARVGERWVNVTTLPMVVAARPLYSVGGERAVLLLPMLGAAFAALAARALARRIAGGDGWFAFWTVGLATPLAVYALDFWEHALGVALVLWAIVFTFDVIHDRAGWRGALASGALFGAAATIRTEALVYAAVAGAVAATVLMHRVYAKRELPAMRLVRLSAAGIAGLVAALVANQLFERAFVGGNIRAGRAAGTASTGGDGLALRTKEALITAVGLNRFTPTTDWIVGATIAALVAYAAWRLTSVERPNRRMGLLALAVAVFLYAVQLSSGLGFVPGMLSASPLAVAGLTVGWAARKWRPLGAIAVSAIPVIWFFQYSGGAGPQWGGRYLLPSSTLLAVAAAVVLAAAPKRERLAFVVLAAIATLGGVAWLSQRSHAVAAAMPEITVEDDTVLVSRESHLLREGGSFYRPDLRWLTAVNHDQLAAAVRIAERVGAPRLELMRLAGMPEPRHIGAYERVGKRRVTFLPGVDVVIVSYANGGLR